MATSEMGLSIVYLQQQINYICKIFAIVNTVTAVNN